MSPEQAQVQAALEKERDRGFPATELARLTNRPVRSATALASALVRAGRAQRFTSLLSGKPVTYYQANPPRPL